MSATDDRIRVLLLLHGLGLGGAERSVYNLCRELKSLGCLPVVCAWRRGGPRESLLRAADVEVEVPAVEPAGWLRLQVAGTLRRIVLRHRIDVIHAHMSDSAFWGIVLQQLTGRPCVITHHSTDLIDTVGRHRWFRQRLLRACSQRAAANIAVSPAVKAALVAEAGLAEERVALLQNSTVLPPQDAVESACAARAARAAAGFATGGPTIVSLGRITAAKGAATLVAAAPHVVRAFPNATFVAVGAGDLQTTLQERVRALGLAARFRFEGAVTDVSPYLASADLYVSASMYESLSMALLEAMSWGVPAVVSDIDGNRALVRAGETGVVVPPEEPALLGAAIVNALSDWRATEVSARRARVVIHERHGIDESARRHVDLYKRVIAESRA